MSLKLRDWPRLCVEAFHCAIDDNCFLLARAASYSATLALFPGLMLVAALLFRTNASQTLADISIAFGRVFPAGVRQMLEAYVTVSDERSTMVLVLAGAAATLFAADMVMSLMEGFRAAYRAPRREHMWADYGMALLLVFLSIVPLTVANIWLILSRQIQRWFLRSVPGALEAEAIALFGWWVVALPTFTLILAVAYHVAPNRRQHWRDVFPGALAASFLWAATTALFTFYVQGIARYSEFYGSVSTVIVLLIWTYLSSTLVLLGCEFNAARERQLGTLASRTPAHPPAVT